MFPLRTWLLRRIEGRESVSYADIWESVSSKIRTPSRKQWPSNNWDNVLACHVIMVDMSISSVVLLSTFVFFVCFEATLVEG